MDPIPVLAVPASAYNPNRRVSDLLLSQLKHFQHVEAKHGKLVLDPALARDIHTEAGAAKYIAAVTRALGGSSLSSSTRSAKPAAVATKKAAAKKSSHIPPLAIAASADSTPSRKGSPKRKTSATAGKKKTGKKKS